MSMEAYNPHLPCWWQHLLINTGASARCSAVLARTVFKPRRGGLFIETDALQIPSFLFFGGAELYGAHGTSTVPRFNGARTNRIRHAPPKNKKEDGRFGPRSINRPPL